MPEGLRFVLRTPHQVVLDERVRAVRVPTETGQAGLRPGGEPILLVVEPGLVLLHGEAGPRFAATAGGLLESGRERCTLYTPVAAVGASDDDLLAALDHLLAAPGGEMAARRQFAELEQRIVRELREDSRTAPRRRDDHESAPG